MKQLQTSQPRNVYRFAVMAFWFFLMSNAMTRISLIMTGALKTANNNTILIAIKLRLLPAFLSETLQNFSSLLLKESSHKTRVFSTFRSNHTKWA
jgi:hypothetical protein